MGTGCLLQLALSAFVAFSCSRYSVPALLREDCPLKIGFEKEELNDESHDNLFSYFAKVTGFNKAPLGEFINTVTKVNKNNKPIKDVIITDPFIYKNLNEYGESGNVLNCLDMYFKTLNLDNKTFNLKLNPSPSKTSKKEQESFKKALSNKYQNIKIGYYKNTGRFHDRLYLTVNKSQEIKGFFGPSLNGLTTNSVVIIGEIKVSQNSNLQTLVNKIL